MVLTPQQFKTLEYMIDKADPKIQWTNKKDWQDKIKTDMGDTIGPVLRALSER